MYIYICNIKKHIQDKSIHSLRRSDIHSPQYRATWLCPQYLFHTWALARLQPLDLGRRSELPTSEQLRRDLMRTCGFKLCP